MLGNMNRAVPRLQRAAVALIAVKPSPRNEPTKAPSRPPRNARRPPSAGSAFLAAGLAYSGLTGIGSGAASTPFALAGAGAGLGFVAASALVMGPGFAAF